MGIIYGPEAAHILPEYVQETFLVLGYIGLIFLVFEAGLSTNLKLLYAHMALSFTVGTTGIVLPIGFSILLLHFGYGYSVLQSFSAGAALSSTSLGTTLALLKPEWRQTRMGVVLLSSALFDDVIGLVVAAIIGDLSSSTSFGDVSWQSVIRPIFVSIAFVLGTSLVIWLSRILLVKTPENWQRRLYRGKVQLLLMVAVLSGFVASSEYAGTSELFGAYLAGVYTAQAFTHVPEIEHDANVDISGHQSRMSLTLINSTGYYSPHLAFTIYIQPILNYILSPIFFASIGFSLPIRSLGSVNRSSSVVWRGWVYSLLMIVAKSLTGVWLVVWQENSMLKTCLCCCGRKKRLPNQPQPRQDQLPNPSQVPSFVNSNLKSGLLLGSAMVARGEIALIVAQLARPLLVGDSRTDLSECFAVVIWAILVDTIAGAATVGFLFRREAKKTA
ncbi:hypothetical protein K435DRAFT_686624 [Dendrothele bispora CBS 962.96]|uniref:Cation/H+ exchanger transmembrane domain-containing protein n=1 Tax=Dendrothele bispora (strain CBS 962.96) TaxID=1314807 RepID=A0A4S8L9L3_DENBC|nr:hypothetical protein K435DRAFT_686624 [Dendrothele bispora CBS 962.96]